jgi:hypothetical protein
MNQVMYKPGERVPVSGIYAQVDRFGSSSGGNATCVKDEPFPPTDRGGMGWVLHQRSNS